MVKRASQNSVYIAKSFRHDLLVQNRDKIKKTYVVRLIDRYT